MFDPEIGHSWEDKRREDDAKTAGGSFDKTSGEWKPRKGGRLDNPEDLEEGELIAIGIAENLTGEKILEPEKQASSDESGQPAVRSLFTQELSWANGRSVWLGPAPLFSYGMQLSHP